MNATPGYRTTEFWLSLLAIAMPLVQGLTAFPNPWISLPAAAVAGAYALSRSQTKRGASDALSASIVATTAPPQVAPSVIAAAADAAARALPAFGAMTADELGRARATAAAAAVVAATPPANTSPK